MRSLLALSGLLLVAFVAAQHFPPGKQFIFDYEGRVASGIVGLPPQYGLVAFKAQVYITAKDPEHVVIQIRNPTVGQYREKLRSESAFYNEALPISYSQLPRYLEEMETPYVAVMRSGQVTSVQIQPKIPAAIQNIQRAIASLVQMNVNGVERFPEPATMLLPEHRDNSHELSFSVMEESIMGTCETLYTIAPLPEYLAQAEENQIPPLVGSYSQEEHLVITKTVNYHNCLKKAAFHHVEPKTQHCLFPDNNCRRTESTTSYTRYLVKGTRRNFIVKGIWNHGKMITRPAETDMKVFSYQTMFLKKFVTQEPPKVPASPAVSLMFDYLQMNPQPLPHDYSRREEFLKYPVFPLQPTSPKPAPAPEIITRVLELLEKVSYKVEDYSRPIETQISMDIHTIITSLRALNYQDLKSLTLKVLNKKNQDTWTQLYKTNDEKILETERQIYLDCLVYSGTNPSVLVIKDVISQHLLMGERAAQLLMTIPMVIKVPVPEVIEVLYEITQLPQVKLDWQLYSTSLLTVSNVVYQACVNLNISRSSYPVHYFNGYICHPNDPIVVERIIPMLERLVDEFEHPYEKEVALRALGNIGHPSVIPILKKYAWGSEHLKNVQIRAMAVFSFDRCAKLYPTRVRDVMIPIMTNTLDHFEVRIAAITMLLKTRPPTAIYQKIALLTWFEPYEQINNYIYSTFKSLSNSTYPTYNETEEAIKAKMVLYLTKPIHEGVQYSHDTFFTHYIQHEDLASKLRLYYIGSEDSLIPRRMSVRMYNYIHGYTYKPYMFSLFNQGTQTLINKLIFPEEARMKSKDQLLPFDIWSSEKVSDVLTKIKHDIIESDIPRGRLHVKLYSTMERFFHYNETGRIVKQILHDNLLDLSGLDKEKTINVQKVFPLRDTFISIPTEVGLPVIISMNMPVFLSVRGNLKSSIEPKHIKPSTFIRNDPPVTFTVDAEIKPMISIHRVLTSYVFTPFYESHSMAGFEEQFQAGLPVKFFFHLNTAEPSMQYKFTPLQVPEVAVFHYHTRPFTTIYNPVSVTPITKADKFLPIHRDQRIERPVHFVYKFGQKSVGLDLQASYYTERQTVDFATFYHRYRHHNLLTLFNFLYARRGPIFVEEYNLFFRPETSETKTIKIQQTRHIEPVNNLRSENDYRPVRYDMYRRSQEPSMKSLLEIRPPRDLAISSLFKQVSYKEQYLHTYRMSFNLEGKEVRQYMASVGVVNYTSPELYSGKLMVELDRVKSPYYEPAKLQVVSELQYPTHKERTVREFIEKPVHAIAYADVHFPENRKIHFGAKLKRDRVLREFLEVSPEVRRCEENEQQGHMYSYNCTIAKMQASTLNSYLLQVIRSGETLPPYVYNFLQNTDTFFKVMLYPYLHNNATQVHEHPSTVYFNFTRNPFQKLWHVTIKKPYETTNYTSLPEYGPVHYFLPLNTYSPRKYTISNSLFKGQLYPYCEVQEKYLRTFDNVTIPIQTSSPNCWHLLAKDCSEEVKMGVYTKLQESGKEVKAILGDTEVRFVPQDKQPKVYVNGKEYQLTKEHIEKPIYFYYKKYVIVKLSLLCDRTVKMYSPLYRMQILHDGKDVLLEMDGEYRNRACGLCGDLNGEWNYDIRTPHQCTYNRTMIPSYFESWILREGSCAPKRNVEDDKCYVPRYVPTGELKNLLVSKVPRQNLQTWKDQTYEERHIEIESSRPGYTCYSVRPVKMCKQPYVPENLVKEKIEFYCAPRGMYVRSERRDVEVTEYMRVPTRCVRI